MTITEAKAAKVKAITTLEHKYLNFCVSRRVFLIRHTHIQMHEHSQIFTNTV